MVSITRSGLTTLLLLFFFANSGLSQANERCKRHFYADSSTVNQFDDRGQTSLMLALNDYYHSHTPEEKKDCYISIKSLLDMGGDPHLRSRDHFELSAFDRSFNRKVMIELVALMVLYGADINSYKGNGTNLLYGIYAKGSDEDLISAIALGVDLTMPIKKDKNVDNTLFVVSVRYGRLDLVRVLVQNGADVGLISDGVPLIHKAVFSEDIDMIRYFIDQGVNLNARNDRTRSTPLHVAAGQRNKEVYDLLLKYGAIESLENKFGLTPKQILDR